MSTWKIDKKHSEIKFKARHLVISSVTGQFNDFDATLISDKDDFSDANVAFEADVKSLYTKDSDRDNHLKSEDFFNADEHPKITFISKSIEKVSDEVYQLIGDITIRGVTKEIKLETVFNGKTTGLDNKEVAVFEIFGELNRFDFNLHWNKFTETGGVVVGDKIKIEIFAEMKKVSEENEEDEVFQLEDSEH